MADSGHARLHELRKGDALMSTETVKMVDERPDWLDGATEIELSTHHLRTYWDSCASTAKPVSVTLPSVTIRPEPG
jgi:hypothetical protein